MNSRTGLVLSLLVGVFAGQVFFSHAQAQQPKATDVLSGAGRSIDGGEFVSGLHARLVSDGVDSVMFEVPAGKAFVLQHLWLPSAGSAVARFTINRGPKDQRLVSLSGSQQRWDWKGPGFRIEAGESLIVASSGVQWLGYSGTLVDA